MKEKIMTIKEAEEITGISKQNIRYYEKQGLLHPLRNGDNDYRVYRQEDIKRLNEIKLFRKLGISIEEIRRMYEGATTLGEALQKQKERLRREKDQLEDVLRLCDRITEEEIAALQAGQYLNEIAEAEKQGAVFADFLEDYKAVAKAEYRRQFSFMPDTMCLNKREMSEALFQYAEENGLDLVITKEGLMPEFTIDGICYTAYRHNGRYGAVVNCEMKNPEDYLPKGMSLKKYKMIKAMRSAMIPIGIFFFAFLFFAREIGSILPAFLLGIAEVSIFVATYIPYRGLK